MRAARQATGTEDQATENLYGRKPGTPLPKHKSDSQTPNRSCGQADNPANRRRTRSPHRTTTTGRRLRRTHSQHPQHTRNQGENNQAVVYRSQSRNANYSKHQQAVSVPATHLPTSKHQQATTKVLVRARIPDNHDYLHNRNRRALTGACADRGRPESALSSAGWWCHMVVVWCGRVCSGECALGAQVVG